MNVISRVLSLGVLMILTPLAVAQSTGQKPPPAQPEAAQAKDPKAGSDDVRKEVGHTVDAIRSYSAERRAEAVALGKRAAEDMDRQMQRLQEQTDAQWNRMNQKAKLRSKATMADLHKRRNALAEWSGGMRHSSTAAWGEVRNGFVKSYQELAEAMRKARAEFDKGNKPQAVTPDNDDKS